MADEPSDGLTPEMQRVLRNASPDAVRAFLDVFRAQAPKIMEPPYNSENGSQFERRMQARRNMTPDRDLYEFPSHLREWFDSLGKDDIAKIDRVIALSPKTIEWLADKNDKELQGLDSAVEFVSSSRTAARVLMYVAGIAFTIIGGAIGYIKLAADFLTVKGGVR